MYCSDCKKIIDKIEDCTCERNKEKIKNFKERKPCSSCNKYKAIGSDKCPTFYRYAPGETGEYTGYEGVIIGYVSYYDMCKCVIEN